MTPGTLTLNPRTPLDPHTDLLRSSTLPRTPLDPCTVGAQNHRELGMHWDLLGEGGPYLGYRRGRPFGACGGLGVTMDTEFRGILK